MAEKTRFEKGQDITRALWGDRVGKKQMPAHKLAPEFFQMVTEFCFGGFYSRPNLALRDRSLCTVAQLAALGKTEELKAHLAGALNLGITRDELIEVLMQTSQYAGIPAALNAGAEVLLDEAEE